MKHIILAITGLPGSGKTEATKFIESLGFNRVRFGDVTDIALRERELARTEKNERIIREELRKTHGMAAYALLSLPRIQKAQQHCSVVLDGLYSWEEYKLLRNKFPGMTLIAIHAPPQTRYARMAHRNERPLTEKEVRSREYSEIENLNKGGTIAMADVIIENNDSLRQLKIKIKKFINTLLQKDSPA
ncbi:MAG: AAA family ATPase [Candidatus Woesearchaeota archaeon]|nr:AAA family ATPase [Candidatus Woesearchaeota archaeon]